MYPDLKLKLADARVEWEPSRRVFSLVGTLDGDARRVQFRYFAVTPKGASPADTRFWTVWIPIYDAMVDIVESAEGTPLPSNLSDRSVFSSIVDRESRVTLS